MCDLIIRETNRKAILCFQNSNESDRVHSKDWKPLTSSEFDAYIGLLLLAGVCYYMPTCYMPVTELWKTSSHPMFRASMSIQRFWSISRFIRFDDGQTRQQRKKMDKAAAISDVFQMLYANLKSGYVPGTNVTVDEQLFAFRGGTGFTQYMPSKPAKYAIKV